MLTVGIATTLTILLAGSLAYCCIALLAARAYRKVRYQPWEAAPPVTIMKPLAGAEDGLRDNLRSFFNQDYIEFEILLAVRDLTDPAALAAREVMAEFPRVPSRLIVSGEAPTPNRKVHSLATMLQEAQFEILLMADSDVRVGPDLLRVVTSEMRDPAVGMVTCPYRASAGASLWSRLEAIGLNTEFLATALVARYLQGMDFALGPTLAIRGTVLEQIGGMDSLRNYLAEDFVMGNRTAALGHKVVFSSFIIDHRLGSQSFRQNLGHRLRWARSTRRSRPWGYLGEIFTNPLPLAVALTCIKPSMWPLLVLSLLIRAALAIGTSQKILRDPLTRNLWYLVPFQDAISFIVWAGGFFGAHIDWRGRKLRVGKDGRFALE